MTKQRVVLTLAMSVAVIGCSEAPLRPDADPAASPAGSAPLLSYNWIGSPWGTEDQITAANQNSEADDDVRWRCPEEPAVMRTWRLTLTGEQLPGINEPDYLAHFTISGPKYYIGYVGRSATGLPLADYRFYETVYSHDDRYTLQPYGRLTLMCQGRYTRLPASRVWAGRYWVVAHQGEIGLGPSYATCPPDGDPPIYMEGYDPYDPGSVSAEDCGGTGGGGTGGEPVGGGGGDDGSGWAPGGFAAWCDDLGGKLYYDIMCLEAWNEQTGEYGTVWCGTAAVCET